MLRPSYGERTQGADFVHTYLATLDDDRAVVDEGLDDRHGAIIEVEGVRVIGGSTEKFDVEGAYAISGFFAGFQAKAFEELSALNNAYAKVIECGIVVNIGSLGDQAVIGNYNGAAVMCLLENIGEGCAVNRCDYENLCTLGDHVFDLGQLIGDVIVSEL